MENNLLQVAQTVGMWAVFAMLYIQERKAHDRTIELYRRDLRRIAKLQDDTEAGGL